MEQVEASIGKLVRYAVVVANDDHGGVLSDREKLQLAQIYLRRAMDTAGDMLVTV